MRLGMRIGISRHAGFASAQPLTLNAITATAAAAYSVRRLRTGYTGPCMTVRRSADNLTANIGFNAAGGLDTAALLAHCGAGSGFITTWHDQSTNARHATQPTIALQPRIINAGVVEVLNGVPAPRYGFAGFCGLITPALNLGATRQFAIVATAAAASVAAFSRVLVAFGNVFSQVYIGGGQTADTILAVAGGVDVTAPVTPATGRATGMVLTQAFGTAGQAANVNSISLNGGIAATIASQTGVLSTGQIIIGTGDATTNWNGSISEVVFLTGVISVADRQTVERRAGAAFGVAVA